MAKTKAKTKAAVMPNIPQPQAGMQEPVDALFDLSNPDEFRKAFLAAEILNRKY